MYVTGRRRNFLASAEAANETVLTAYLLALQDVKKLIDEEVDRNLQGGMVQQRSGFLRQKGWSSAVISGAGEGDLPRLQYRITDPVGVALHQGVAHEWTIRAAPGSRIHFIDKFGNDAFTKEVTHPAVQPRPFIRVPFQKYSRLLATYFREHLNALIEEREPPSLGNIGANVAEETERPAHIPTQGSTVYHRKIPETRRYRHSPYR